MNFEQVTYQYENRLSKYSIIDHFMKVHKYFPICHVLKNN